MRKILLWGRMTPYANDSVADILLKNKIASNPGNLLFTYSVSRAVMTDDAELVPFYSEDVDRLLKDVNRTNAEYDCAVIPLANAFRADFLPKLENLTRFVRGVKIPCYVIGVGVQARNMDEIRRGFVFDAAVKDFASAVLEKSAKIGVRGEITGKYLQQMGFLPEQHFTVIGCPAAYIRGPRCSPVRLKPFDEIRRVSVNAKPDIPAQAHDLIRRSIGQFDQANFVTQNLYEMWNIYFGTWSNKKTKGLPDYYPFEGRGGHIRWPYGRVTSFLRATDWMRYMQEIDLSFGSRIHGNLVAAVSGTPVFILVGDTRVEELANYHGLPCLQSREITEATCLRDLYENADYGAFARNYDANFRHFVDFLNDNGIRHIYGADAPEFGCAPCDLAIEGAVQLPDFYLGMPVPFIDRLRKADMYRMLAKYKVERVRQNKKIAAL